MKRIKTRTCKVEKRVGDAVTRRAKVSGKSHSEVANELLKEALKGRKPPEPGNSLSHLEAMQNE